MLRLQCLLQSKVELTNHLAEKPKGWGHYSYAFIGDIIFPDKPFVFFDFLEKTDQRGVRFPTWLMENVQ